MGINRSLLVEQLHVGRLPDALTVIGGEDLVLAIGMGVDVLDAVEGAVAGAEFVRA